MQPDDDYAYDPIAEAIGWLIRGCAGAETWLNAAVSTHLHKPYPKVERDGTQKKVDELVTAFPDLEEVGRRLLALFDVRHAVAHGIGARSSDGNRVRMELYNRQDPNSPKFQHLDRRTLVELADEARELGAELQMWMIDMANTAADDETEFDDDHTQAGERSSSWITDETLLAQFPSVTPGRIYSMHQAADGAWWGVIFNTLTGKPRMVRPLPDLPLG